MYDSVQIDIEVYICRRCERVQSVVLLKNTLNIRSFYHQSAADNRVRKSCSVCIRFVDCFVATVAWNLKIGSSQIIDLNIMCV